MSKTSPKRQGLLWGGIGAAVGGGAGLLIAEAKIRKAIDKDPSLAHDPKRLSRLKRKLRLSWGLVGAGTLGLTSGLVGYERYNNRNINIERSRIKFVNDAQNALNEQKRKAKKVANNVYRDAINDHFNHQQSLRDRMRSGNNVAEELVREKLRFNNINQRDDLSNYIIDTTYRTADRNLENLLNSNS